MKLHRLCSVLAAALIVVSPLRAAEQSSYVGPTAGPMNMATFVGTYLNPALRALAACHWGSSAPANGPGAAPLPYQSWCDTTTNPVVVKQYDGASWAVIGKLNTSSHVWTPSYQGTDLSTAATASTGVSGHVLGFLDGINTYSANQSFNSGTLILKGSTSGTTTMQPAATASGVITIPAATDTLMGKATADTMTNKTFDTAGTGNSFLINGLAATANTGTGAVTRASGAALSSPGLTTPVIAAATPAAIGALGYATGFVTWYDGSAVHTLVGADSVQTLSNKTIDTASANALKINGNALSATAGIATVTVPNSTDTLVGRATTDTLTNKTFDTGGTGNALSIAGVSVTANSGTGAMVRASSPTLTTPALAGSTSPTAAGALGFGAFINYGDGAANHTLVNLDSAQTLTSKTLTSPSIAGGALSGTFSGAPTFSGALAFSGVPLYSGLSAGTCSSGLGLDASNNTVKISCPGSVGSIQVGTTGVTSGTTGFVLKNTGGFLDNASVASLLTAGNGIALSGTNNVTVSQSLTNAVLLATPANPTGTGTTTAMMGLGASSCRITPVYSGRLTMTIDGRYSNAGAGVNNTMSFRYGSGAGPANGAASTGTTLGNDIVGFTVTAGTFIPFSMTRNLTGLTPGTTYWMDIALTAGAGTSSISNLTCTAIEF